METTILELDSKINQLKQEQNFSECLNLIEKTIGIKAETYGKKSRQFYKTAKDLCDVCNLIALSFLETNNKDDGLAYLLKAEKLFRNHKELLNIVYNNIGCYYRFLGKNSNSMQYLEKALKISYDLNDKKKAAETHLNISTVLTNLSKFKLANEQCLSCIILVQEDINDNIEKISDDDLNESLVILVLSYQSLAIQHENMNNTTQALLYYQIAENLLRKLRSSGDKEKLDSINKMIDDYYKLKLINKITAEKQDYIDSLGEYFHKRFTKNIRRILEENISCADDNSQEDVENDEFEEMPTIIYSEPERIENEEKIHLNNKSRLENEDMIGALKEIESKIEDDENLIKDGEMQDEEDMENMNNYTHIVEQMDDEGNLRNTQEENQNDDQKDENNEENNDEKKNQNTEGEKTHKTVENLNITGNKSKKSGSQNRSKIDGEKVVNNTNEDNDKEKSEILNKSKISGKSNMINTNINVNTENVNLNNEDEKSKIENSKQNELNVSKTSKL